MKIALKYFVSYVRLAGVVLGSTLLFFGCSKDDGDNTNIDTPTSKAKVAEAIFTRINTATYPTTFEGHYFDRIAISDNYIYVIDMANRAFRRYNVTSNAWQDLASTNLIYSGVAGYLVYHNAKNDKDILIYNSGSLYSYYPPEYPDAALRDSWVSTYVVHPSQGGERGAASDGEYLYYMGNARVEGLSSQIDRFNPNTNFWEENIGFLPVKFDDQTQAVASRNKLFVVGESTEIERLFMVYDLHSKKGEIKPAPTTIWLAGNNNNTLLVYQNYLIYMVPTSNSVHLYVFDIEEDQWLENHVEIKMDLFSKSTDNASLLLSSSGKLYAAGTKAGDFVLYNVDFKVLEK